MQSYIASQARIYVSSTSNISSGQLTAPTEGVTWDGTPPEKKKHTHEDDEDDDTMIAQILDDGRIDVLWGAAEKFSAAPPPAYDDLFGSQDSRLIRGDDLPESARLTFGIDVPPLNIVMQIVGSRGDVQPFIPIARRLVQAGHRVRVATHERFRSFVKDQGLEFYPLGGDPEELMAFMVKNRTVIPGVSSMLAGDVGKKRKSIAEILKSTWDSCVEPDQDTGEPFYANAIIANPPSFGFSHCAEALGIPCHVIFTMPWSATRAFPHPLTNVSYSGHPSTTVNYASYAAVEMLTWIGLADLTNDFRRSIGLHGEASAQTMSSLMSTVPHTYLWSPSLIPKPKDWGKHIDVAGFSFMDAKPGYLPPQDLVQWLRTGPAPFYIGFGSIAGFDMVPFIEKIMAAVREVGIRVIVSKGWGGANVQNSHDVYMIGDCPHDWLFTQVAGVVHHGGAGTTAAGLRLGLPTIVCPFFADQPFWGAMCATAGAGPTPIPARELTTELMAEAIRFCQLDSTIQAASALASKIGEENGADAAVRSFISHLPVEALRNEVDRSAVAAILHVPSGIPMSFKATKVLLAAGQIRREDLADYKPVVWTTLDERGDVYIGTAPFTGVYKAVQSAVMLPIEGYHKNELTKGVAKGVGSLIWYPAKSLGLTVGQLSNGFRAIPAWYDPENQRQRPEITGIKGALVETGKSTVSNTYHALTDVLVLPVTMGLKEGPKGIARGVGVGLANFVFKGGSVIFDIASLPAKGIYREFSPKDTSHIGPARPGLLVRLEDMPSSRSSKSSEANMANTAAILSLDLAHVASIIEGWNKAVEATRRGIKGKGKEGFNPMNMVASSVTSLASLGRHGRSSSLDSR